MNTVCRTVQDSTTLSTPRAIRDAFVPPVVWLARTRANPTAPSMAVPAPTITSSATALLGSSRFASRAVLPGSRRQTALQADPRKITTETSQPSRTAAVGSVNCETATPVAAPPSMAQVTRTPEEGRRGRAGPCDAGTMPVSADHGFVRWRLAGRRCCGPGIGPGTSVNRVQDGQLSLIDGP